MILFYRCIVHFRRAEEGDVDDDDDDDDVAAAVDDGDVVVVVDERVLRPPEALVTVLVLELDESERREGVEGVLPIIR